MTKLGHFRNLVLGKAIVLTGANAITFNAIQELLESATGSSFNVVEVGRFSWGSISITRQFDAAQTSNYVMKIAGFDNQKRRSFPVSLRIVAAAIERDVSVIAMALQNDPKASKWIGEMFSPHLLAAVEKGSLARAAEAKTPTKLGGGPLRV